MARGTFVGAIVLVVSLAGCEARSSSPSPHAGSPDLTVGFADTLRIGSHDDAGTTLTRVGGILPLPDGGVWVAQTQEQSIRIFDEHGEPTFVVGGPGQGPGEFMSPGPMGWWGASRDTVWIRDDFARRLNLFDAEGAFVRAEPSIPVEVRDRAPVSGPEAIYPDSTALGLARSQAGAGPLSIVRFRVGSAEPERIVATIDRTSTVQIRFGNEELATGQHPMPDSPIVSFAGPQDRILITDRATTRDPTRNGPEITLSSLTGHGDTLWSRRLAYQPTPVSDPEWDSLLSPRIESFQRFAELEGRLSSAEAEEAYRASVLPPAHRPPVRSVHMDDSGRILLEWSRPPGASGELWLLDPDGEPRVRIEIEGEHEVLGFADPYVWMLELDEFEVPYLIRYRLAS
ncbi:MAG: hypothetical protein EA351_13675 [Gemmatimonadales bacterium]|nr:MAG: hypothetical protein EA351_13675 [Gemmatimonadales bacterium]